MKEPVLKVVIVEDMVEYIEAIEILLNEIAPEVEVVGKASTLKEAEKLIVEIMPDVVLLDIQFENEGKTGFDLLDDLKDRGKLNFQLIIITAHIEKQYYAKAFEYRALHFIEKPVGKLKLKDAIERVKQNMIDFRLNSLASLLENEVVHLKSEPKADKINIEGIRYNEIVEIKDIIWIEADGRKSNIFLRNDKMIVSCNNIGAFKKQLNAYSQFFCINRSEIININFVERYSKKEKLVVLAGSMPNHYVSKDMFSLFVEKINSQKLKISS